MSIGKLSIFKDFRYEMSWSSSITFVLQRILPIVPIKNHRKWTPLEKWRFKTQQTPRKEVAQSHPKIIYKSTESEGEINWHKSWSFQVKKSLRQFFWVGIRLMYTARKGISTVATALEPHEASNALLQDSIFQKSPQSTHTHRISINFNNINSTVSHNVIHTYYQTFRSCHA